MYLTYDEYQNMGGALDEATFNDLEFEAETYVDWHTFNRLQNEVKIPERVKKCMYQIIKLINQRMTALQGVTTDSSGQLLLGGAGIASQSNDGVSVSFNTLSAKDVFDSSKTELDDLIERSLQGVVNSLGRRLLYKGVYPNE